MKRVTESPIPLSGYVYSYHSVELEWRYKVAGFTYLGFYTILVSLGTCLFMYRAIRLNDKTLRERSIFLIMLQISGSVVYNITVSFRVGLPYFPCFLEVWLVYLSYTIWCLALVARSLRLIVRARSHWLLNIENEDTLGESERLEEHLDRLRNIKSRGAPLPTFATLQSTSTQQNIESNNNNCRSLQKKDSHRHSSLHVTNIIWWSKGILSNKFIVAVIVAFLTPIVVMLILMNCLSENMSLNPMVYNCTSGWNFYPLTVISGVFDIIIFPVLLVRIWKYRDAYMIRSDLAISICIGVVMWIMTIVWRFRLAHLNIYAPPNVFMCFQLVAVFISSVVVPALKSVSWEKRRRIYISDGMTKQRDTILDNGIRESSIGPLTGDATIDSFCISMKDPIEWSKIKQYSKMCFCSELVSFITAFQALRSRVLEYAKSNEFFSNTITTTATNTDDKMPRDSVHTINSKPGIPLFLQDSTSTAPKPYSTKQSDTEPGTIDTAGIIDHLSLLLPALGVDQTTVVPDPLRKVFTAFINTFIVPESSLAVNTSSYIVEAARSYINGGQMEICTIDNAKDEVLELLYMNVYLRYRVLN